MKQLYKHEIPDFSGMTKKNLPAGVYPLLRYGAGMTIVLLFSFWLMFHTFSYDAKNHEMLIAGKAWSDFGAHLPLIRSFSLGDNLNRLLHLQPVESPLFPGEPIRYHFLFYALVGFLEKIGLRIDWALNLPSALGFFFLMVMIFLLSYYLFTNYLISFLSVIFFLFNGSLSFLYFFQKFPLLIATDYNLIYNLITNSHFSSFGPWDGKLVSAFWSLNIYTNQRHLGLSFALALLIIYLCLKHLSKGAGRHTFSQCRHALSLLSACYIGLLLGVLLFLNLPAAACTLVFLVWFFLLKARSHHHNFNLITTLLLLITTLLPFLFLLFRLTQPVSHISYNPGYLIAKPLSLLSFLIYWFYNLGLHLFLIPLGLLLAPRKVRLLLLVPLAALFILPNLFQFSPDMINNHKFFNFFMLFGNMLTAYALVYVLQRVTRVGAPQGRSPLVGILGGKRAAGAVIGAVVIGLLILSGVIDLFPIINDHQVSLSDYPANPDIVFFREQTKPGDVALNSTWFYNPASLAGRSISNGYSYFTWSYGYDQSGRENLAVQIYRSTDLISACLLLEKNNISYAELSRSQETFIHPNLALWNSLPLVYYNQENGLKVFSVKQICQ